MSPNYLKLFVYFFICGSQQLLASSERNSIDDKTKSFFNVDVQSPVDFFPEGASGSSVFRYSPSPSPPFRSRSTTPNSNPSEVANDIFREVVKKTRIQISDNLSSKKTNHYLCRELAELSALLYLNPFGSFRSRATITYNHEASFLNFNMPEAQKVTEFNLQGFIVFLETIEDMYSLGFSHNDINVEHLRSYLGKFVLIDWGNLFAFTDNQARPRTYFDGREPFPSHTDWSERSKEDIRDIALTIIALITQNESKTKNKDKSPNLDSYSYDLSEAMEDEENWEFELSQKLVKYGYNDQKFIDLLLLMTNPERQKRPNISEVIKVLKALPQNELVDLRSRNSSRSSLSRHRSLNVYKSTLNEDQKKLAYILTQDVFKILNQGQLPLALFIDAVSLLEMLPESLNLERRVLYALCISSTFYTHRISNEHYTHGLSAEQVSEAIQQVTKSKTKIGSFDYQFDDAMEALFTPEFRGFIVDHPLRILLQNFQTQLQNYTHEEYESIIDEIFKFMLDHSWQRLSSIEIRDFLVALLNTDMEETNDLNADLNQNLCRHDFEREQKIMREYSERLIQIRAVIDQEGHQNHNANLIVAPADGNCGFHALSTTRMEFINDVLNEARNPRNNEIFSELVRRILALARVDNLQAWEAAFANQGQWVEDAHLELFAHIHNAQVQIFHVHENQNRFDFHQVFGDGPEIFRLVHRNLLPPELRPENNRFDANHYDALLIRNSPILIQPIPSIRGVPSLSIGTIPPPIRGRSDIERSSRSAFDCQLSK